MQAEQTSSRAKEDSKEIGDLYKTITTINVSEYFAYA